MFKKKNGRRMLSAFLALCTVFSLCVYALPVYAVDSINAEEITSEEIISENAVAGEKLVLNADDVPELIDFQTAKDKGHVLRLRQKESDAHTVIFLNDDNTETMYIFAEPVKYTDSDGNVKDKSRSLSLENGKYTMAENDVQVSFPTGVNDGISVSKGDVNITMIPVADTQTNGSISATATAELVNNKVSYSNVFGAADLQYTPLYSGFKEDIILESYTGVSEFNFIVYTNGLTTVKNENGSVSFIDPLTNSAVAEMMQVVCYDAEQDFDPGDVRITTIKENGIYGFTVIADVNFLTAEDTLYPVSVDPTIELTGTTAIEDAVVYSGKPNSNYGSYHYNNVGYVDDSYKIGRLFVRFPTLASNPTFSSLDIDDITSATLSLYTSSRGTGSESMKLYQYFYTWSESTITWSSANYSTMPLYINTVQFPSASVTAAQIPMTGVVRSWANDNSTLTGEMGIFLDNTSNSDPDLRRSLLSTEYATANNTAVMPCLEIEFTDYAQHLEAQQTWLWCWVACARMASSYYQDSNISQASAAVKIKLGIETNSPTTQQIEAATIGGTASETAAALEYILNYEYDAYYAEYKVYDLFTLRTLVQSGNPVIALVRTCDSQGMALSGHAILIVDYYYDSVETEHMFVILDPGPVNQGSIYALSYYDLCDSRPTTASGSGSGEVWVDSIVLAVGDYYDNTTPCPEIADLQ